MAGEDLHERLSSLPGVERCSASADTISLLASPGTDLRLLKARAQVVCAEDGRPLVVVQAAAAPPGRAFPRAGPALASERAWAVATASLVALSLIAFLPGNPTAPSRPDRGPGAGMASASVSTAASRPAGAPAPRLSGVRAAPFVPAPTEGAEELPAASSTGLVAAGVAAGSPPGPPAADGPTGARFGSGAAGAGGAEPLRSAASTQAAALGRAAGGAPSPVVSAAPAEVTPPSDPPATSRPAPDPPPATSRPAPDPPLAPAPVLAAAPATAERTSATPTLSRRNTRVPKAAAAQVSAEEAVDAQPAGPASEATGRGRSEPPPEPEAVPVRGPAGSGDRSRPRHPEHPNRAE